MNGPFPRGQMVQFNKVTGKRNKISFNSALNIFGQSYPEDVVNLYQSNGTVDDPIQVVNNYIVGGGPSLSGTGTILGDGGGMYQYAAHNIIINPGQVGIAVASGEFMTVENNTIYGKAQNWTNVGLYVWNQYNFPCDNIIARFNLVNWKRTDGLQNDLWDGNNCGNILGWDSNVNNAPLTENIPKPAGVGRTTVCDSGFLVDGVCTSPATSASGVLVPLLCCTTSVLLFL